MINNFASVLIVFTLFGCGAITGEELGRLAINKTSNDEIVLKEITLQLKKDEEIGLWTEMDMEYEGNLEMGYTLEVWRDSVMLGGFQLNALDTNPTMMEIKTSFGKKTSWSYTGKMDFLTVDEDGEYKLRAVINSSDNPSLNLKKAELVFKK